MCQWCEKIVIDFTKATYENGELFHKSCLTEIQELMDNFRRNFNADKPRVPLFGGHNKKMVVN